MAAEANVLVLDWDDPRYLSDEDDDDSLPTPVEIQRGCMSVFDSAPRHAGFESTQKADFKSAHRRTSELPHDQALGSPPACALEPTQRQGATHTRNLSLQGAKHTHNLSLTEALRAPTQLTQHRAHRHVLGLTHGPSHGDLSGEEEGDSLPTPVELQHRCMSLASLLPWAREEPEPPSSPTARQPSASFTERACSADSAAHTTHWPMDPAGRGYPSDCTLGPPQGHMEMRRGQMETRRGQVQVPLFPGDSKAGKMQVPLSRGDEKGGEMQVPFPSGEERVGQLQPPLPCALPSMAFPLPPLPRDPAGGALVPTLSADLRGWYELVPQEEAMEQGEESKPGRLSLPRRQTVSLATAAMGPSGAMGPHMARGAHGGPSSAGPWPARLDPAHVTVEKLHTALGLRTVHGQGSSSSTQLFSRNGPTAPLDSPPSDVSQEEASPEHPSPDSPMFPPSCFPPPSRSLAGALHQFGVGTTPTGATLAKMPHQFGSSGIPLSLSASQRRHQRSTSTSSTEGGKVSSSANDEGPAAAALKRVGSAASLQWNDGAGRLADDSCESNRKHKAVFQAPQKQDSCESTREQERRHKETHKRSAEGASKASGRAAFLTTLSPLALLYRSKSSAESEGHHRKFTSSGGTSAAGESSPAAAGSLSPPPKPHQSASFSSSPVSSRTHTHSHNLHPGAAATRCRKNSGRVSTSGPLGLATPEASFELTEKDHDPAAGAGAAAGRWRKNIGLGKIGWVSVSGPLDSVRPEDSFEATQKKFGPGAGAAGTCCRKTIARVSTSGPLESMAAKPASKSKPRITGLVSFSGPLLHEAPQAPPMQALSPSSRPKNAGKVSFSGPVHRSIQGVHGHPAPSDLGHLAPSVRGHLVPSSLGHSAPSAVGHLAPSAVGHLVPSVPGHPPTFAGMTPCSAHAAEGPLPEERRPKTSGGERGSDRSIHSECQLRVVRGRAPRPESPGGSRPRTSGGVRRQPSPLKSCEAWFDRPGPTSAWTGRESSTTKVCSASPSARTPLSACPDAAGVCSPENPPTAAGAGAGPGTNAGADAGAGAGGWRPHYSCGAVTGSSQRLSPPHASCDVGMPVASTELRPVTSAGQRLQKSPLRPSTSAGDRLQRSPLKASALNGSPNGRARALSPAEQMPYPLPPLPLLAESKRQGSISPNSSSVPPPAYSNHRGSVSHNSSPVPARACSSKRQGSVSPDYSLVPRVCSSKGEAAPAAQQPTSTSPPDTFLPHRSKSLSRGNHPELVLSVPVLPHRTTSLPRAFHHNSFELGAHRGQSSKCLLPLQGSGRPHIASPESTLHAGMFLHAPAPGSTVQAAVCYALPLPPSKVHPLPLPPSHAPRRDTGHSLTMHMHNQ